MMEGGNDDSDERDENESPRDVHDVSWAINMYVFSFIDVIFADT